MTNPEKKAYLSRYVNSLGELMQLEELKSKAYSIQAQIMTGMPSAQRRPDKLESAICNMIVAEDEFIDSKIQDLADLKMETYTIISKLGNSNQRQIMYYRYIYGLKWEEICVKMSYSWMHTHRLHSAALNSIILKDVTKCY